MITPPHARPRFYFLGPAATILRPLACFSTAFAFQILNCEIGRAIDGNCSQSQDFMDTGSFLFLISDFVRAIGRCCFQPRDSCPQFHFCVPKFQIGRPISGLGTKFRIWGQHSSGGDYILHFVAANSKLGVRFPVWRLSFAFGGQHWPGGTEMLNDRQHSAK